MLFYLLLLVFLVKVRVFKYWGLFGKLIVYFNRFNLIIFFNIFFKLNIVVRYLYCMWNEIVYRSKNWIIIKICND